MKPGEMNSDSARSSYSNSSDRQPAWKKKEFQKPSEQDNVQEEKERDSERSREKDERERRKEREKRRRSSSSSSSGVYLLTLKRSN